MHVVTSAETMPSLPMTMQWQWNSSGHGRHSVLAIIYSSCGQCYQSLQEICEGEGEGAGYRDIGAYTDLCASLQHQLGNRIFIPTFHRTKVTVCMCGGKNVANSYVSHINMHVHVYC